MQMSLDDDGTAQLLESSGLLPHLRRALTLVCQRQPAEPLPFLRAYFRDLVTGPPADPLAAALNALAGCGGAALLEYDEEVAVAYATLAQAATPQGTVPPGRYNALVRALCDSVPAPVASAAKRLLCVSSLQEPAPAAIDDASAAVPFAAFAAGTKACLLVQQLCSSGDVGSHSEAAAELLRSRLERCLGALSSWKEAAEAPQAGQLVAAGGSGGAVVSASDAAAWLIGIIEASQAPSRPSSSRLSSRPSERSL